MRILADENIPFVKQAFSAFGDVQTQNGRCFNPADVRAADVLLIRSVTKVDQALLAGSRVRFVASATAGIDHVDQVYLRNRDIGFAAAAGSNANAVAEYVLSAVLSLTGHGRWETRQNVMGIIGCGHVGSRLRALMTALGWTCLVYDPPLQAENQLNDILWVDFESVLQADIISLHVPLKRGGSYPSYHMIDATALECINPNAILINTARGAVIDNSALKRHLSAQEQVVVLDVWENEPEIDPALLSRLAIGTPHIAGYSYDARLKGVESIYQAFCNYFNFQIGFEFEEKFKKVLSLQWHKDLFSQIRQGVLAAYDVCQDHRRLKAVCEQSTQVGVEFDRLRKTYPVRREFSHYQIAAEIGPAAEYLQKLGFGVVPS